MAAALRAAGVREHAISVIADEQEAITAALQIGAAGDLLLVIRRRGWWRSWKARSPKFSRRERLPPARPSLRAARARVRAGSEVRGARTRLQPRGADPR